MTGGSMLALGLAAQARAAADAALAGRRRLRIVCPHGGFAPQDVAQSNGVATGGTARFAFMPTADTTGLEFVFVNGSTTSGSQIVANGNALRLLVAVEVPPLIMPLSFAGAGTGRIENADGSIANNARSATIVGDGAIIHSLPLRCGVFAGGATQYYRTHVKVAAGERWPFTNGSGRLNWGGVTTSDQVYGTTDKSGTDCASSFNPAPGGPFSSTAYAFGATAIIGEQLAPAPVVLVTGDSISNGDGDDRRGRGYLVRALTNAGIGYHANGVPGAALGNLARFGQVQQYLARYADHVVIHCGTNDLSNSIWTTLAQAQASILTAARGFATAGARIWFCTILPRTTSSDNWSTSGNQALPAFEGLRVRVNNWMRDAGGGGLRAQLRAAIGEERTGGVVDACAAVERNPDATPVDLRSGQQATGTEGLWIATGAQGYATVDGIHPTAAAAALLAQAVPIGGFTV